MFIYSMCYYMLIYYEDNESAFLFLSLTKA